MSDEDMRDDSPEEAFDESDGGGEGAEEFEIDADAIDEDVDEGSIDQAMKEALDAVEQIRSREAEFEKGIVVPVAGTGGAGMGGAEVEALRAEIEDLKDRSVRTLADFDNYRKRVDREREEARRYSNADSLRELLGVVDNMERAMQSSGSVDDLKEGVTMTLRQFREILRGQGVRAVEADGEKFDPAVHDAVSQVASDAVDVPTVDSVLQKGYMLHDRLLRPAMVIVAMPAAPEPDATVNGNGQDAATNNGGGSST